jgi:two-component system nitrate/nitrite response regulator NarL
VAVLVLGDDQFLFLDALSTVLTQHSHTVAAVTRSAREMVAFVRSRQPDLCLIDRHLATDDDAEIIGGVIAASHETSAVVLSSDPRSEAVGRALGAGACGYLHKSRGVDALVSALDRVLRGEVVVDVPQVAAVEGWQGPNQAQRLAARLTNRERECLLMLVEGLSTSAMIARLGVSRTTVRAHLQSVFTKLGVHSRLEAASFAVRAHLAEEWSGGGVSEVRAIHPHRASATMPGRRLAEFARRTADCGLGGHALGQLHPPRPGRPRISPEPGG